MFYGVSALFGSFNVELRHFGFILTYGMSTIVGSLILNKFYTYKQFYFKQFSIAYVRSLNVKTILFQTILFNIDKLSKCQKQIYFK